MEVQVKPEASIKEGLIIPALPSIAMAPGSHWFTAAKIEAACTRGRACSTTRIDRISKVMMPARENSAV